MWMTQRCVCMWFAYVCVKQRHVSPVKAVMLSGTEGGSEAWKHSWHPADLYWTSSRSDTTSTRTQQSLSTLAGPLNRWHATTWTWRPWRGYCHRNLSGNSILLLLPFPEPAVLAWYLIQRLIASLVDYRKTWIVVCLFQFHSALLFWKQRWELVEKKRNRVKTRWGRDKIV